MDLFKQIYDGLSLSSNLGISDTYSKTMPLSHLKKVNKRHFETCPICGAERKTLYYQAREWKCLKCCK